MVADLRGTGVPVGTAAPGAPAVSTVVLVLTDVEGSTRSWAEHPAEMDAAMSRHHQIVHAAVTAHGGWRPVDQGEGDAVFAVFESAAAAVAAVVELQQELAGERWPPGIDLRVRVGIHAGEVTVRGGNVFGSTVNRCARLRSLGSGGQVLLSAPAYELARDSVPARVTVLDLGEHRMKDLTRAESVYQLVVPGLPAAFPPLASLDRARHNLPVQTSSFVGRTREIADLVELVRRERLVTVVGFGGMGKTRLALQVAAELATGDGDGVWFVDLSAVTDPAEVPAAVATTLGVVETSQGLLASVVAAVSRQRVLLVLDNMEQLLPDAALVVDRIVRAGPGVRVLATSREPLHLSGEYQFALSALPVPPLPRPGKAVTEAEVGSLATYDAVRLFTRRASAVSRGFVLTAGNAAAIAAICGRLDGMPLALELAAARTRSMSPEALLPRLDHALTVLTGGSRDLPSRQQTVRATIAWSYDALTRNEQHLLDRLSVFRGTFTLDAAEAICGPATTPPLNPGDGRDLDVLTGLTRLVDHCLVIHQPTDGTAPDRYTTLVSVHEYAADQLDRDGGTAVRRDRHARYFPNLVVDRTERTLEEEDRGWELAEREIVELRAALEHLRLSQPEDGESTLALKVFAVTADKGLLTETRAVCDAAVARTAPTTAGRIELLLTRSIIEWNCGQATDAALYTAAAVAEARALGEPSLLAAALGTTAPRTRAHGAKVLAEGRAMLARLPIAGTYWPAWKVNDFWASVTMLYVDADWTESVTRHSFEKFRASQGPSAGLNLGYVLLTRGRLDEAQQLLAPLEQLPESASHTDHVTGLFYAAMMRLTTNDAVAALRDLDRAEDHLDRVEMPGYRLEVVIWRAIANRMVGDRPAATRALLALLRRWEEDEPVRAAQVQYLLAVLARESGDRSAAADHLRQAWSRVAGWDARCLVVILECMLERAIHLTKTDPAEATRLIGLVHAHRGNFIFLHGVDYDTDGMLADLRSTLGDEEVDRILTLAATQPLPDSPVWPDPPHAVAAQDQPLQVVVAVRSAVERSR